MKATAEKSSATTVSAAHTASSPFFAKAGGGDFFAPVSRGAAASVQTKLTVNKPGDKFEQEADATAERVMRMPDDKKKETGERTSLLTEDKLQKKENDETTDASQQTGKQYVDKNLQSAIRSKTSGGEPINGSTRNFMEPRFGNDFSNVRIHNDASSAQLNGQLNAKAFTYQNHIFFGAGQYQPESSGGKQLLAHELTHVVQQGASTNLNTGLQRKPESTGKPMIQRSILGILGKGSETKENKPDGIFSRIGRVLGQGISASADWISGLASKLRNGIEATWNWIQNVAKRIGNSVTTSWNFIGNLASKMGLGEGNAWGWIHSLAGHMGLGIISTWDLIRDLANKLQLSVIAAWRWINGVAGRLGTNALNAHKFLLNLSSITSSSISIAWRWISLVANTVQRSIKLALIWIQTIALTTGHGIGNAWLWIQSVGHVLGQSLAQAWLWILNKSILVGLTVLAAWMWLKYVAELIGKTLTQVWWWIFFKAIILRMSFIKAWNWIMAMAQKLGMGILSAWALIVKIASEIGKTILNAWHWLVNLARKVGIKIYKAWDWYLHAPKIKIETRYEAPDGSGKNRKKIGVGERVTFKGSKIGKWKASGGSPQSLAWGQSFAWTAPGRAKSITISLKSGKYTQKVVMGVLEPNAIKGKKESELRYQRGRMGAGMKLKFHYYPKTVSFGNVESKEVSGEASNIRGYFLSHGGNYHHDSGDTFFPINNNNVDSVTDEASIYNYPSPWTTGGYDWIIPNHFKLRTEAGDGKKFTEVTQAITMEGTDGTSRVAKGGEEVERTP